jgi:YVTN family beta-propeller protein
MAFNPATNKLYVLSNTKNVVTVVDGATRATATVNVGQGPTALDIDPGTNKVFVANTLDSTLTVIDGATNATSTIALIGEPISVAVNPSTHMVYAAASTYNGDFAFGVIEVVDESTGAVAHVDAGVTPTTAIALDAATNMVYFGNENPDPNNVMPIIVALNGASNAVTTVGPLNRCSALAIDTAENLIVASTDSGINFYNFSTGLSYELGQGAHETSIAVDQATHTSYFSDGLVLDDVTRLTARVSAVDGTTGVLVDSARGKVYYASFPPSPAGILVLDVATQATTMIPTSSGPAAMAENASAGLLYVLGSDAAGTLTVMDVSGNSAALSILYGPQSQTAAVGVPVALNAVPQNPSGVTFQWYLDGAPLSDGGGISGSQSGTLYISRGAGASDAGSYTCTLTSPAGSMSTQPAALTVNAGAPGRLVNLSSRAEIDFTAGPEPIPVTAGFGASGTGTIGLVLRGVGPALISLGVDTVVTQPTLSLYDGSSSPHLITTDTGWQNPPSAPAAPWAGAAFPVDATAADFQAVGAFALTNGYGDDAVKVRLPVGTYTEVITAPPLQAPTTLQSTVLAEIYNADAPGTGSALTNLSTQAYTSGATIPMTVGFVIAGPSSMTVLVRVSGPALAPFGVTNFNSAPILNLYDSSQALIGSNASWQGNAQVAAAAAQSGAFAWPNASSHDDAILVTLPPGSYTASVVGQAAGMALVEVYAVSATP